MVGCVTALQRRRCALPELPPAVAGCRGCPSSFASVVPVLLDQESGLPGCLYVAQLGLSCHASSNQNFTRCDPSAAPLRLCPSAQPASVHPSFPMMARTHLAAAGLLLVLGVACAAGWRGEVRPLAAVAPSAAAAIGGLTTHPPNPRHVSPLSAGGGGCCTT